MPSAAESPREGPKGEANLQNPDERDPRHGLLAELIEAGLAVSAEEPVTPP